MPKPDRNLRVGTVPYLVARPLDCGLEAEPGIDLIRDVPAQLVRSLRSGDLDVALVSSIELFRQPGYAYLPDLTVAANGYISSVLMFHERPLEELRSVALDPASRAARALLQVVLSARGVNPEWIDVEPGRDPREAGCDAWLRIGDPALRERVDPSVPEAFSPSEAWMEMTGAPFPFAVWIVRQGVDLSVHGDAFLRSRERGAAALETFVQLGAETWGLDHAYVHSYLAEESLYSMGEALPGTLEELRDRAARLGLCEADLSPGPVGPLRSEGVCN